MKGFKVLPLICMTAMGLGLSSYATSATAATAATNAAQETTGQYAASTALTTKVKTALLGTSGLDSNDIAVVSYEGVVQLSGFVDTHAQSKLAQRTAAGVSGVKSVRNNLIVKSTVN